MARCRSCDAILNRTFVDLGLSPLANSYRRGEQLGKMEPFYPLHALVCEKCLLVQLDEFESPEHIFSDYAYLSSYSETWLEHAKKYVDNVVPRFNLGSSSLVVEIASNDGYLLKNFLPYGIEALGIEPAKNVSEIANQAGVNTLCAFFGNELAQQILKKHGHADLMIANNVVAHVPQLNNFLQGFATLLGPYGVITFEFPHLLQLIQQVQFDTIYHEHFSYFSLFSAQQALSRHKLRIFDAEKLTTHGGSLRLYVCHENAARFASTESIKAILREEAGAGLHALDGYKGISESVQRIKYDLLSFLIAEKRRGNRVAGYGAPAKGNTLLNYCGIRTDLIEFTVDKNPSKQGTFLPGTHIPVLDVDELARRKPNFVLILPWNLEAEIVTQLGPTIRGWGAKFVVSHPHLRIIE